MGGQLPALAGAQNTSGDNSCPRVSTHLSTRIPHISPHRVTPRLLVQRLAPTTDVTECTYLPCSEPRNTVTPTMPYTMNTNPSTRATEPNERAVSVSDFTRAYVHPP